MKRKASDPLFRHLQFPETTSLRSQTQALYSCWFTIIFDWANHIHEHCFYALIGRLLGPHHTGTRCCGAVIQLNIGRVSCSWRLMRWLLRINFGVEVGLETGIDWCHFTLSAWRSSLFNSPNHEVWRGWQSLAILFLSHKDSYHIRAVNKSPWRRIT